MFHCVLYRCMFSEAIFMIKIPFAAMCRDIIEFLSTCQCSSEPVYYVVM